MHLGSFDGHVGPTTRAKTVAPIVKGLLVLRAEHLVHRLLHDPIDHVRDSESSLTSTRLGDPHAPDIPGSIAPVQQAPPERGQTIFEVLSNFSDRLPVGARGSAICCDVLKRPSQVCIVGYLLHRHRR
jgi:hypothetical protein